MSYASHPPSFIEKIDPRVKFLALVAFAVQAFLWNEKGLVPEAIVLLLAGLVSQIPISVILRRLRSVTVFLAFIIGINMFTIGGRVLFEVSGMYATREGLYQGMILSARIVLLLFAATVFVRTTTTADIVDGIESAFRRLKSPLVQVLTIALNFVPFLIQSARQIKNAQIVRGANPDRNIARQLRFAATAVVPLFAAALRSSEHLAQAMEARGYDPHQTRSHYVKLEMQLHDWIAVTIVLAQCVASAMLGHI